MVLRPNIRKTLKWSFAVLTVLLAAAWIASGWQTRSVYPGAGLIVTVAHGQLCVLRAKPEAFDVFRGATRAVEGSRSFTLYWCRFHWTGTSRGILWMIAVPAWLPAVVPLSFFALIWLSDTLARRRGHAASRPCPDCFYDLAGLPLTAVCPECGRDKAALHWQGWTPIAPPTPSTPPPRPARTDSAGGG